MAPKDCGGLGVGSLRAQNSALLMKWWWRLKTDKNQLWQQVIVNIHNLKKKPIYLMAKKTIPGTWLNISKAADPFIDNIGNPKDIFSIKVGNGINTLFWKDRWLGPFCLQDRFPGLYSLEKTKLCCVAERYGPSGFTGSWMHPPGSSSELADFNNLLMILSSYRVCNKPDSITFSSAADGRYSVDRMRLLIDSSLYPGYGNYVCWSKCIPLKVSCFVWRALLNRIPTTAALASRGIQISSQLCTFCHNDTETVDHLLVSCPFSRNILNKVFTWCKLPITTFSGISGLIEYAARWGSAPKKRKALVLIIYCTLWCLWMARNNKAFRKAPCSSDGILDCIISTSFHWASLRGKWGIVRWVDWVLYPLYM